MTRKDFELIAGVVENIEDPETRRQVALNFGVKLRRTNDRFNLSRFVVACGCTKPGFMDVCEATDRYT